MAPRKAGARYAGGSVLSSVTGWGHREHRVDAAQCARASEKLEGHIDGRRDRRAGHGDPQRLRDLAETTLQARGEIVEHAMYRCRVPLRQPLELLTHLAQYLAPL